MEGHGGRAHPGTYCITGTALNCQAFAARSKNRCWYRREAKGGKGERERECVLCGEFNVLTLNCEESAGLLTPEMQYLHSAEMMG